MWYKIMLLSLLITFYSFTTAQVITSKTVYTPKITINNTSSFAGKSGYYKWTVFVETDEATLSTINYVEYLLHPTFSKPQVSSYNRTNNFSYTSTGWGEFEIKAKVVFKNKQPPQYIPYWLRLKSKIVKPPVKTAKTVYKSK